VCAAIEELLAAEGIRILTSHQAARVAHDSAGIHLTLQPQQGTPVTVSGSHLLVAIGRIPNTDRLNLEAVGVATDARGYIPTDNQYRTNVPGIYALGDVNGRGAFTHTSYQDHEIMLDILAGGQRRADERTMAYAMYTDPPMGRVGWGEREARASGRRVLMAIHEMKNVSRAKEESETHGLIKLLVDAETEQFVGACVFGIGGDEIIQVISNFMAAGGSYRAMKDALPIHPTVTEFFPTILGKLAPLA
jgi:pyruvate/2-oxoglutarate dehydrogenase complex dihydrolipoamide dehydrogenase (E3) component